MSEQALALDVPFERAQRSVWAFAHTLAAGVLAGLVFGVIAGGVGGRIAMRISAVMAGDEQQGALTDAEEIVGEITVAGTLGLVVFGGALIGIFGGVVYLALRRWLADAGPWRGTAFGLLLLAMLGWGIIEGDNGDFDEFGPPAANVTMFAAIFIAFGLLIAPLYDRMRRVLPPPRLILRFGPLLLPKIASPAALGAFVAMGFAVLVTLAMVGMIVNRFGEEGDNAGYFTVVPAYVLLAPTIAGALLGRMVGGFDRLSDLRERASAMALALAVVAVPIAFGLVLDVQALVDIFQSDA